MKIKLHKLRLIDCGAFEMARANDEIEVETEDIRDLRFASFAGGCLIDLETDSIMVDENPNYVSLLAGFIEGEQCATGSRTGTREYYRDQKMQNNR